MQWSNTNIGINILPMRVSIQLKGQVKRINIITLVSGRNSPIYNCTYPANGLDADAILFGGDICDFGSLAESKSAVARSVALP